MNSQQAAKEIRFRTMFCLPPQHPAAIQKIEIRSTPSQSRTLTVGFNMHAAVAKKTTAYFASLPGA